MNPDPLRPYEGLDILLGVEAEGWDDLLGQDPEPLLHRAVRASLEGAGLPGDLRSELSVTLADDARVREVNAEWRGKDKPTNILSFPAAPIEVDEVPGAMMGDLILARETLEREAREEDKRPADHFAHLIVHGILHLLGHDHIEDEDAERMEALEISILAGLSIGDPYLSPGEVPEAALIAT